MNEKGSALITIILVVLVLTMVGLAGVLYMNIEDRISSATKNQTSAMYAAEGGLRLGEAWLWDHKGDPGAPDSWLGTSAHSYLPPGSSTFTAQILDPSFYNVNAQLNYGARDRVRYSIYVRNNFEDPSGIATDDTDGFVNLLVVGEVWRPVDAWDHDNDPGTPDVNWEVLAQKVYEEQLNLYGIGSGGDPSSQKGGNFGGTGAQLTN